MLFEFIFPQKNKTQSFEGRTTFFADVWKQRRWPHLFAKVTPVAKVWIQRLSLVMALWVGGLLNGANATTPPATLDLAGVDTTLTEANFTAGLTTISSTSGTPNLTINLTNYDESLSGGIKSLIKNFTLQGSKKLTLSGASSYTGTTTISGGTLQIGDGGTTGSIIGNITNNFALSFNRTDTYIYTGAISGSGMTTINSGTLQIGNGGIVGSISTNITNNAALIFNRSDPYPYAGLISGTGTVTQSGTGTLTLSNASTYTGTTTIDKNCTLIGNISTSADVIINGAYDINGSNRTLNNISGNGILTNSITINTMTSATLTLTPTTNSLFAGQITGGKLNLTLSGSGTLKLTGANTYAGTTTINSGTLQIGDGGTTGSISRNITNNAALIFNRSDDFRYDRAISGTGTVTQAGSGTVTLGGINPYTGMTFINAGTLAISNGVLPNTQFTLGGGTLKATGNFSSNSTNPTTAPISKDITLTANSTIDPASFTVDLTGQLFANGHTLIIKTPGSVTYGGVILSGSVDFTPSVTVPSAQVLTPGAAMTLLQLPPLGNAYNETPTYTLTLADGSALPTGLAFNAATRTLSGTPTTTGQYTLKYTATTLVGGTGQNTFSLTVENSGDLLGNPRTLTKADAAQFANTFTNSSATQAILTVNLTADENLSGAISGKVKLVVDGGKELCLSGVNTYTEGTVVNSGTLEVDHVTDGIIDALGANNTGNGLTMGTGTTLQCGSHVALANANPSQLRLPISYAGSITIDTSDGTNSHALTSVNSIICTAQTGTTNQLNVIGGGVYIPAAPYTASTGTDIMAIRGSGTTVSLQDSSYVPGIVSLGDGTILKIEGNVTLPALTFS